MGSDLPQDLLGLEKRSVDRWKRRPGTVQKKSGAVESLPRELPETSSHKIPKDIQRIMLQSHLCGTALDLSTKTAAEAVHSAAGVVAIFECCTQKGPLSVISYVYQSFQHVLNTERGPSESF